MLLATVREQGRCPCPRCTTKKTDLDRLGDKTDEKTRTENVRTVTRSLLDNISYVRKLIFGDGRAVNAEACEARLRPESNVATDVRIFPEA